MYGLIGHALWRFYNRYTPDQKKAPIVLGQIFPVDLELAMRRMNRIQNAIATQRANAMYYLGNLKIDDAYLPWEPPKVHYNRYMFPVRCLSESHREKVAYCLNVMGIEAVKPYKNIAETARGYFGYEGDCPNSELAARTTILIPVHHRLTSGDVAWIALSLNKAWDSAR